MKYLDMKLDPDLPGSSVYWEPRFTGQNSFPRAYPGKSGSDSRKWCFQIDLNMKLFVVATCALLAVAFTQSGPTDAPDDRSGYCYWGDKDACNAETGCNWGCHKNVCWSQCNGLCAIKVSYRGGWRWRGLSHMRPSSSHRAEGLVRLREAA
eukprot:sb/3473461/